MSIVAFGQNKNERKFDLEIFDYLNKITDQEYTSVEAYLINSKPFSKWDMRPLESKEVKALDSIYTSSQIPNFIWGAFSDKYKISIEEAMAKANTFLGEGAKNQDNLTNHFKLNIEKFDKLSSLILTSTNKIFLNQKNLQRIDTIFKENNLYWGYIIPKGSPYPISPETKKEHIKFSKQQDQILNLLNELNIYSAVKTTKGIFYLVDGFTDNSYGFYFNEKGHIEEDHLLFEIMKSEKIADNYFYYIAN